MLKTLSPLAVVILFVAGNILAQTGKTRIAVVGLDHDHVWGRMKEVLDDPDAELVAVADPHADLVERAKKQVPASVEFFPDYVKMLDAAKPDAVIVTTANDRHLEILKACAQRHIHYMTEKPMAATAADAREMARLAREAGIKLMVNYWNLWAPATQDIYTRIQAGEVGPVQKIIVEYGHRGPKEIGVSKYFAEWLYDPVKNGGGALMDFGCYGADWAVWLKGRPTRVFATSLALKTDQHNQVEDDAVILVEYPDATAVLLPSWDWPYDKGEVQVYGPKGSLIARGDGLLFQSAAKENTLQAPEGVPLKTTLVPPEKKNGVTYFVSCIRNNRPIEGAAAPDLNVTVNEILDAAKESIQTGRAVPLR